jgi:rubrerythrin
MADNMTLLRICAEMERENADLYHWLSQLFQENRRAALLWKKTALEEENHECQFILAEKLAAGMLTVPLLEEDTAVRQLEKLRALRREFEADPPTLVRALESAIILEEDLAKFHLEKLLLYSDEDDRKMFAAMMDHDSNHAETLRSFYAELVFPAGDAA